MNVTVVYFGSIRGLRWTRPSIARYVVDWNASRGIMIHSIGAINIFKTINSPRSGELDIQLDPTDINILDANLKIAIQQDDKDIAPYLAAARAREDFYSDDYISVRNLLHQLNSLKIAWREIQDSIDLQASEYYLFVRPDLRYETPLRISSHLRHIQATNTVLVPQWQSFGGFNDRIALADRRGAEIYASRLDYVAEYCESNSLHAERLLGFCLERERTRVGRLHARASRVRSDGTVVHEAFGKSWRALPRTPRYVTELDQTSTDRLTLRARDRLARMLHKR